MTLEELPRWAHQLVERARVARLAFLDGSGNPRVLPVTFALAAGSIWSAVDEKPKRPGDRELARVRWLRRNPHAALCVDHYEDDWSRLAWVQALGRVEIVAADDGLEALEALAGKYPQYRERQPPGPLLRLVVERALSWRAGD